MKTLDELKAAVLADGIIDANEIKEIESVIYADGKIDKDEANFLFDLNDAVSGKANNNGWQSLFVKAISAFVLEDDKSPNEIDADEAEFLYQRIQGDNQIDAVEKALLLNLKDKAKVFPDKLNTLL